jgi:hypothetical protein
MKKNYLFFAAFLSFSLLHNNEGKNLEAEKTKILENLHKLKEEILTHQEETEKKVISSHKEINELQTNLKDLEKTITNAEVELARKTYDKETKKLESLKEKEQIKIQKLEEEKCKLQEEMAKKNNYLHAIEEKMKEIVH